MPTSTLPVRRDRAEIARAFEVAAELRRELHANGACLTRPAEHFSIAVDDDEPIDAGVKAALIQLAASLCSDPATGRPCPVSATCLLLEDLTAEGTERFGVRGGEPAWLRRQRAQAALASAS